MAHPSSEPSAGGEGVWIWRSSAQAASAIIANRLRSGLGALAIGVAVATLLIVNVALDGIQQYAEQTTARSFGADTFLIAQLASPGRVSRAQLREQLARNPPITRLEASFLQRHANGQVRYAPNAQTRADVVRAGRRAELVPVTGTTSTLAEIRDLNIVAGRFLAIDDEQTGSQVAVIGADIAETLFPGQDPVGGTVRLAGRRFEIIGVQGRIGSGSLDKYVWIPIRAFERAFGSPRSLQLFAASAGGGSALAEDHARISLRAARALQPEVPDTFDVLAPEAARGFVANLSTRIGAAAAPISLMALLAAIVVVANTILVSVTQRTREIGLRRALGARRADIVREVLAESVMLALAGGGLGAAVVSLGTAAIASAVPVPLLIAPSTLAMALVAAATSGILAGWLPAVRATRLDVIAALRSE